MLIILIDYAAISGQELWSTARTQAYLANVGSPFTSGAAWCSCPSLTPVMLDEGNGVYETPALDPAPWYDPDHAVSAEFLGFLPLRISGLEDNTRTRNVTNAVGGGGVFGPARDLPRTITVSGLLVGTTCCGVEFGLHYLSEAMRGCTGDECDGSCFEMFNCCPSESSTRAEFLAEHRRTFQRTALVSGPEVTGRTGTGSCAAGACAAGGDIVEVEFVLVAASPWPWTDLTPLLDVALPATGTGDCIEWCVGAACTANDCKFAACTASDACDDPRNPVPTPPAPTVPESSFCIPLADDQECYTIDLSTRPQWGSDVPVFTLSAGASELRNVHITFYERKPGTTLTCPEIADASRCDPVMDFFITYVPAGGEITVDGRTGRPTLSCQGTCRSASTVFGNTDGGPVRIEELTCAGYCVCLGVDPAFPPAADARFSLSVSGRNY